MNIKYYMKEVVASFILIFTVMLLSAANQSGATNFSTLSLAVIDFIIVYLLIVVFKGVKLNPIVPAYDLINGKGAGVTQGRNIAVIIIHFIVTLVAAIIANSMFSNAIAGYVSTIGLSTAEILKMFTVEAVGTFIIVLFVYGTVDKKGHKLMVAFSVFVAVMLGAKFNPARILAAGIAAGNLTGTLVPFIAPLVGVIAVRMVLPRLPKNTAQK